MSFNTSVFSATRWVTLSSVTRACVQLLQTAVLARLLTPVDFGLMAMAGVALALTSLLTDVGLSSALMHYAQPDRHTLSTLYWLNLGAACLLAFVLAAMAWLLAAAYGQPELAPVLAWLALVLPISAIGQQFRVLAEKNLNFKPLSQNEVISALAAFLIAVGTAYVGWGVYAIVAAQLVAATVSSGLAWLRLSNHLKPQTSFRWPLAKPFIRFGLHRMGDSFWNTARNQADVFIAGLFTTSHAVATYAVPRDQSLKIANVIINPIITRVSLPIMAKLNGNLDELQHVYLRTLRLTASFNFPAYAILFIFAEQVTLLLLGHQWQEAVIFFRIFAIWGLIRSTGNPSGSLLYAVGMARRAHIWNLLLFLLTTPIFWMAMQHGGLLALAWTMVICISAAYVSSWRFLIYPACGISFYIFSLSFARPLATTALATIITFIISSLIADPWKLPSGTAIFSATYLTLSYWLNREFLKTFNEFFSPLRRLLL